ncbi:hypothetical protein [Leptolyngbya sp. GGD]|uniref:hypothetical protein n=1 Tax=Leptolyngbya sp. GGD TaxID=2997907 RepID=UPI00227B6767|nr:hypothetical protein [Leptolyngbya sp. GGD]MCY6492332.1 hypothetical protein [Leptolyngbya sp. GGD]
MIDNSESNDNEQPSQMNEVRLRCPRLIDRVAKSPGSARLLQLAEKALTNFANYKANRSYDT